MSDSILYQDINIEIKRKINKNWKFNVNYFNFIFEDRAVLVAQHHELIHAQIAVLDLTYRINRKHSLRWEFQGLWTKPTDELITTSEGDVVYRKEDQGDWAGAAWRAQPAAREREQLAVERRVVADGDDGHVLSAVDLHREVADAARVNVVEEGGAAVVRGADRQASGRLRVLDHTEHTTDCASGISCRHPVLVRPRVNDNARGNWKQQLVTRV